MLTRLVLVSPKYMEGDLRSGENWNFIARFCFLSFHGKFQYDIEYPEVRTEVQSVSLVEHLRSQITIKTLCPKEHITIISTNESAPRSTLSG